MRIIENHRPAHFSDASRTPGLSAPPSRALRAVFEGDSLAKQFIADFVGAAKVFCTTRFVAFSDQCSDPRVGNLLSQSRAGAQESLAFPPQQTEQPAERAQLTRERC